MNNQTITILLAEDDISSPSVIQNNSITILLVEDDDIDAEAVVRGFKKLNIINKIVRVHDGIEALDVLQGKSKNQTIPRPYLILLDINMPRMNGLEFLQTIRSDNELQDSIVFMLTTSESLKDINAAKQLQAAAYMNKSNIGPGFLDAASKVNQISIITG